MLRTAPENPPPPSPHRFSQPSPSSGQSPDPTPPHTPSPPLHRLPGRESNLAADGPDPRDTSALPVGLFRAPHSVLVFGPSRRLVRLTLFSLASATNPDLHWVEFSPPTTDRTPCDPVRLGWIPADRLWLIDPPESLQTSDPNLEDALSKLISDDEPSDSRDRLAGFLRLPDVSQQIIASQVVDGHPGVVVVTEVHRASRAFTPNHVPWILSLHRDFGLSVMIGHNRPPGPGRDFFDFVFRVQGDGDRLEDWMRCQLICEKGIRSGPLRERRPVPLGEIPLIHDILARACPAGA